MQASVGLPLSWTGKQFTKETENSEEEKLRISTKGPVQTQGRESGQELGTHRTQAGVGKPENVSELCTLAGKEGNLGTMGHLILNQLLPAHPEVLQGSRGRPHGCSCVPSQESSPIPG